MIRRGLQQRAANDSNAFKKVNSERSIAFDSDVVHLSGNETVSGYKTFANDIYVGDASLNNVRITQTDIRKMTDGSVKTYSFPDKSGYFSLEGHKHESIENLQNGTKIYSVGKDGKIDSYGNSLEFDSTNQATGQNFHATMSFGKAFNEIYEAQDESTMSVKLRLYMKDYPYFPLCEELNTVATKSGNNWFLAEQPVFSDGSWGQYADYFRTSPFYFNFEIPFTGNFYFGEYWGPASYSDTDARSGVITKTIATESDIDSLSGSISKNYLTKDGDQVISNKYLNGPFIFSPVQISDSERIMNTSLAKDDMFNITYKFPSVKSDGSDEDEWVQKSGNSYTLETKEDASATYVLRNNGITYFWNNASASEGVQIGVAKLAIANPDFLTPIEWRAGMPTFQNPSGGYYFLPNLKSNGSQELFSLPYSSNGTKSYGIIAGSSQFPQISGDSQVSDKDNLIYALRNFGRGNSVIVSPDLINSPGMPFIGTMNRAGTGQVWYYLPQLNERHESEQNILATLGDIASETSGYLPLTGGDMSGVVNDEIDWPYISATNILLEDEADGTSNKVMVNVSLDTTSSDLIIAHKTKEYPSPIAINTEIVAVTGNPSEFPMDITKLSGEKSLVWTTGAECYRYIDGNDTLEIWLGNNGNFDFYFSTSDEEHYYGTESITPTETTKKVSSRFITEMEVDHKLKANASFDLWRKGNTIYAGTGSDHLSAGTNNGVFIGSNQTITDGKGNSVVIGSNAKSNGGSNTIIGYGAYATGTGTGNVLIGYNARNTTNQGNAISIGYGAVSQYYGIAIGHSADANKENAVSIGWKTNCRTAKDIAIGREAQTSGGDGNFSNIAIGAWSKAFSTGGSVAINIGGGTTSGNMSIALGGSVYANDAIQLGNGDNRTPNTLQYRNKTIADTAGRLYYGGEDIDSLYVSKKNDTTISANLNATLEHQMGVGDIGNDEPFALMYANDQDGYLYAGKSMQEYTWLNTGKICSTTDAEATTTELLIPPPSGSGTIATQEWTKKATNILPIASFANYPSTIAISADKYAYRISDTGATGAFPSLTPPSGLGDCYLKFEIEWTTSATLLSYPQSGTTVPAMEWITPPPPPEDGNAHTFYIAGRYDYTRGMFTMNCWRDVVVGG